MVVLICICEAHRSYRTCVRIRVRLYSNNLCHNYLIHIADMLINKYMLYIHVNIEENYLVG